MERGLSQLGFGALLLAALVLVPLSAMLMPSIVASHFAIDGTANGFMPRSAYLLLIEEALPAQEGIETPTSFSYTSASWESITPRLQALNPYGRMARFTPD